MEPTIQKFIWRHCRVEQLFLLAMTSFSFPILYLCFEMPKLILDAIVEPSRFPETIANTNLNQLEYIFFVSFIFLFLTLTNGGLTFWINVYRNRVGERVYRRLRYILFNRALGLPLKKLSQAKIISIISSELEPLTGLLGGGMSLTLMQVGTILTILIFIFVHSLYLGVLAIALYPIQLHLAPKLQEKIRKLKKDKRFSEQKFSLKIGESMKGIQEIRTNNTSGWELANIANQLGEIFEIRHTIFKNYFLLQFVDRFITQITPFFFYTLGCLLVISNDLSLGGLVAIIIAYKDLTPQWQDLIDRKDKEEAANIKYDHLLGQFQGKKLIAGGSGTSLAKDISSLTGHFEAKEVSVRNRDGFKTLEKASVRIPLNGATAILGNPGSGGDDLVRLIPRLVSADSGSVTLSGYDIRHISEATIGERISYADDNPFIFDGTIRENLLYSLKRRQVTQSPKITSQRYFESEARKSGNTVDSIDAGWIDYSVSGLKPDDFNGIYVNEILETSGFKQEALAFGLKACIDPSLNLNVTDLIIQARKECAQRFEDPKLSRLIERFDSGKFNNSLTIGENIFMGVPIKNVNHMTFLAGHPYSRSVLERAGILDLMMESGLDIAMLMLELFQDLPDGHEFFEKYSFIQLGDLSEFQIIINQATVSSIKDLSQKYQAKLLGLALSLIPDKHRLGLASNEIKSKILTARSIFSQSPPEELKESIVFFNFETYNWADTVHNNIIFGRLASGKANAEIEVRHVLLEIIANLGLTSTVAEIGLDQAVGSTGCNLSINQQQKLGLARALIKKPDLMVLNDPLKNLDPLAHQAILKNTVSYNGSQGLIWVISRPEYAKYFDHIILVKNGQVVESGTVLELSERDSQYKKLLSA